MRIKRFSAPTLKEAVDQMKKELGNDAIVLESRKVKKDGIFDFSNKERMEILAALDSYKATSDKNKTEQRFSKSIAENRTHKGRT